MAFVPVPCVGRGIPVVERYAPSSARTLVVRRNQACDERDRAEGTAAAERGQPPLLVVSFEHVFHLVRRLVLAPLDDTWRPEHATGFRTLIVLTPPVIEGAPVAEWNTELRSMQKKVHPLPHVPEVRPLVVGVLIAITLADVSHKVLFVWESVLVIHVDDENALDPLDHPPFESLSSFDGVIRHLELNTRGQTAKKPDCLFSTWHALHLVPFASGEAFSESSDSEEF